MILPTKHLSMSKCLLGSGARILEELKMSNTVSSLWEKVKDCPEVVTFERFLLALSLLYSLNAIEFSDGLLRRNKE